MSDSTWATASDDEVLKLVEEKTSFLPSHPTIARRYLRTGHVSDLVEDGKVANLIRAEVEHNIGVSINDDDVLKAYLDYEGEHPEEIIVRDYSTWGPLRDIYNPDEFRTILVESGTYQGLLQVIDEYPTDDKDSRDAIIALMVNKAILAAIKRELYVDVESMLEEGYDVQFYRESPEHQQWFTQLSNDDLRTLVDYARDWNRHDLLDSLMPIFYYLDDRERFMYYASLLSPVERIHQFVSMFKPPTDGDEAEAIPINRDLSHPIIREYARVYPNSDEVKSLRFLISDVVNEALLP